MWVRWELEDGFETTPVIRPLFAAVIGAGAMTAGEVVVNEANKNKENEGMMLRNGNMAGIDPTLGLRYETAICVVNEADDDGESKKRSPKRKNRDPLDLQAILDGNETTSDIARSISDAIGDRAMIAGEVIRDCQRTRCVPQSCFRAEGPLDLMSDLGCKRGQRKQGERGNEVSEREHRFKIRSLAN
ncbi:unnamed protein product [Caenorhabditis nigoni]